jgi:hypothetical protein
MNHEPQIPWPQPYQKTKAQLQASSFHSRKEKTEAAQAVYKNIPDMETLASML